MMKGHDVVVEHDAEDEKDVSHLSLVGHLLAWSFVFCGLEIDMEVDVHSVGDLTDRPINGHEKHKTKKKKKKKKEESKTYHAVQHQVEQDLIGLHCVANNPPGSGYGQDDWKPEFVPCDGGGQNDPGLYE